MRGEHNVSKARDEIRESRWNIIPDVVCFPWGIDGAVSKGIW